MKSVSASHRRRERFIALALLALFMFCPPMLLIIDRLPGLLGWLPLYLFIVWGVLIGFTAWLVEPPKRP